jgi:hypothetical protein
MRRTESVRDRRRNYLQTFCGELQIPEKVRCSFSPALYALFRVTAFVNSEFRVESLSS